MDSMGSLCSPHPGQTLDIKRPSKGQHKPKVSTNVYNYQNSLKAAMYGLINSILVIPIFMSFATIIFRDEFFHPYMPSLIKLVGASCVVHQIAFTCLSSLPFAIGQVQDAGLIFLSAMSSSIVTTLTSDPHTDPMDIVATTLITLAFSTACLGIALVITGKLKLASYVQYLPMPVVGGYLAYIGFFCLEAGLSLMSGLQIKSIQDWSKLWDLQVLCHVLPGFLIGCIIFVLTSRIKHYLFLPCLMFIIPSLFYIITILCMGYSIQELRNDGWISQPPDVIPRIQDIYLLYDFNHVHWSVLPNQILTWFGMYFVVAFSSSLDVAAIEMNLGRQLDYNHELKTVGWSNAASGITGGFTGSYIFSQTIFTLRSETFSRITGIVIIICELIVLILPISLTAYLPKLFFGSLLSLIAVDLMMEWMIHARNKLRLREYGVVWGTFILINILGLEMGMIAGIILAAINFLYSYSKAVFVMKRIGRSMVQRSFEERAVLATHRSKIVSLELHGYFFFGSSLQLLECMKEHIYVNRNQDIKSSVSTENTPLKNSISSKDTLNICTLTEYSGSSTSVNTEADLSPTYQDVHELTHFVLLDFGNVTGLDATASRSCFSIMKQILIPHNIKLLFSRIPPEVQKQLIYNDVLCDEKEFINQNVLVFNTVDEGIEWCEDRILEEFIAPKISHILPRPSPISSRSTNQRIPLRNLMNTIHGSLEIPAEIAEEIEEQLELYFIPNIYMKGECLFQTNDPSDSIYIIASGQVELRLPVDEQRINKLSKNQNLKVQEELNCNDNPRLTKISDGGIVGEVNYYLQQPRAFSCIVATDNCLVYEIQRDSMNSMMIQHPAACNVIQKVFLKGLSLSVLNHLLVHHTPK